MQPHNGRLTKWWAGRNWSLIRRWAFGLALVGLTAGASLAVDLYAVSMLNIDHWSWIILSGFALCGFLVKTTGLTYLRRAFKDGKKLAGGAFVVVMVLAVLQSAGFELTFYGTNYGDAQARRQQKKDVGTDLARRSSDLEAKLETRSTKRTPAEVEQAIKLALAKKIEDSTLGRMTANCSAATTWAYTLCPPVIKLRTELEAARGYAQNEADLKTAREGRKTSTAVHDAHPGGPSLPASSMPGRARAGPITASSSTR